MDTFATCSSDMSIQICKVSCPDASAFKTFTGHSDEVNAVCWSPGGAYLASCSDDNTAKIWSVEEGLLHDLKGHLKEIYTVRWTPTGPGSANPDKSLHLCIVSPSMLRFKKLSQIALLVSQMALPILEFKFK